MRTLQQNRPETGRGFRESVIPTIIDLCLLGASSLLFTLSFPNILTIDGLAFPLAFVSIVPVFIVVRRASWIRVFVYGAAYGYATYAIFNYWLATFHPIAFIVVPLIYATYFLMLFPVLKLIDTLFPDYGYLLQAFAWIGYEYLRTLGFLGYAYGIIGYSQYLFLPLANIASLAGIWGVSLLVVFPQPLIARCLSDGSGGFVGHVKKYRYSYLAYAAIFCAALVYGFASRVDVHDAPVWRTALIQQNSDPWKNNYEEYERTLDSLIRLSLDALESDPDIVIWSETAFVPAIEYHLRYRESAEAARVVLKLADFMKTQSVPYVIGNDQGVKIRAGTADEERIDYNASLLFENGEIVRVYRKTHLVPFTEHFPYRDIFPGIYDMLVAMDTHFWEKGSEYTVFESDDVRFSTPICFEDTFGYLCRRFCNAGAEVLVNLTNDSWSGSVVSEVQHMSISVFRAIENRRSMVRSTNSGITCVIDPNGRIRDRLPPFEEAHLVADVPVYAKTTTLYALVGDSLAVVLIVATLVAIVISAGTRIRRSAHRVDKRGFIGDNK